MSSPILDAAINQLKYGCMNELRASLLKYLALVERWNPALSLVSAADVHRLDMHTADSLSLAPYLQQSASQALHLLDVGSGAGFPAIPLKLAVPDLPVTLVERSEKKSTFLGTCIRSLELENVTVLDQPFTVDVQAGGVSHITCRAVDRPEEVAPSLIVAIAAGATLLCQSERLDRALPPDFVRKPIEDEWSRSGLRRGPLTLISAA